MKVDYQKQTAPSSYRFHPIHLQWSGVHVAVSAILFHIAASRLPDGRTTINPCLTAVIGFIVFSVNMTAHLLDSKKPGQISAIRSSFTKSHRSAIIKLVAACIFIAVVLSAFLSAPLWKFGLELGVITALWLWLSTKIPAQSTLQVIREPVISTLYTAGIWGCLWCGDSPVDQESITLAALFSLLTFLTLLLNSHFEALDRTTTPILARWLGKPRTRQLFYILVAVICAGCIFVCLKTTFRYTQRMSVIFASMSLLQLFIFVKSGRNDNLKRWWLVAELSGIFPFLLL